MSRRSHNSMSHERRLSKYRVSDDDLFDYVLRVALLSYLIEPKPTNGIVIADGSRDAREKDALSSRLTAVSSSILSIGDLFRDVKDGPKSAKFPEKLVKVLEQRLQDIAMNKDPQYSDQLIRRTMAVFYGQFMKESFRRPIEKNRKIEELILLFATHATSVLRKEPTLEGEGWKIELNNQIWQFITLLRDCLRNMTHVSPELLSRLDMYSAKLAPSSTSSQDLSGYESATSAGSGHGPNRDSVSFPLAAPGISFNVADMHLVQVVSSLFKVPESAVQKEVDRLRPVCTEKAALIDLKACLKNINAGSPFPGRREDFASDAAWQHWKTLETAHLSQLMVIMVQFNPELAKSTPSEAITPTSAGGRPGSMYSSSGGGGTSSRHGSVSSRRSMFGSISLNTGGGIIEPNPDGVAAEVNADDDIPIGHQYTYIPPNPKKFYKRLVECCLIADLETMMSPEVEDTDEVSLGILSAPHIELINECALRWRIGQPYRVACFLEIVKQLYERNDVPMECIPEALSTIQKVMSETDLDKWPLADVDYLANIYGALYSAFVASLYHSFDSLPNVKPSEIEPLLSVLEHLQDSGLLERFEVDIGARITDVQDRIKQLSGEFYDAKMQELQAAPGVNRALPLLLMTDEIEKHAKALDKRFPEPILGKIDVVSLMVEIEIPLFLEDIDRNKKKLFESSMNGPTPDVPIQDIFALYRRTKMLTGMLEAFSPKTEVKFDLHSFFEPYVRQWLVNTDSKTGQWVQAAIAADKFEAEGDSGHSSSIVDLFDSLRSPITFLQDLEWSDPYQEGRFFTSLSKTISKAIEQYCRSVEDLFMAEMFPRPTEYLQPQKTSAWLEKAKQLATTGEKKVEPFNFQPVSCVKLNNIEAARKLLDNMYNQIEADKIAETIERLAPPVPDKQERPRFLFTVKISIAEGLVPLDSSPSSKLDTFVTLSDESGNRLAKTRTIYESLNPRWDETFDMSVEKPLWLMVSVRDRALVGKHDTVGRAYICLDPRRFGDFLAHDIWLDLDSQGRILLRVSMEGEKDDIRFFFGSGFRSLKRAEADMVRIFIDKMSPFIQQSLSRTVLKSLLKTGATTALDYNKALGNVTALYRSALGGSSGEVQIPLPQSEKPRVRPDELTDVEIEQAILPLFDYFDANLQTLNTYLSDTAKEMVMIRVWKEILNVIEGLLIPPLSEKSSEMKPLSDKEVDIVFKWLKFLRDYFYAGGEGPVPLEMLQNQKYRDVVSIRLYYDWHTDALMEECVRMMSQSLRSSVSVKRRAKSVYQQRNLGTIKERKKEKQQEKDVSNGETILRILRMRPNTSDFIAQQLQSMAQMQAAQQTSQSSRRERKSQRIEEEIPPVPSRG